MVLLIAQPYSRKTQEKYLVEHYCTSFVLILSLYCLPIILFCIYFSLLSRMTQSQISARRLINSCLLWWSGRNESLTSVSCLWMTRSSCCVLVNPFACLSDSEWLDCMFLKSFIKLQTDFSDASLTFTFSHFADAFIQSDLQLGSTESD